MDFNVPMRGYDNYCRWWSRKGAASGGDLSTWVAKRVATGDFYAQIVYSQTLQDTIVGGSFMYEKNKVTLKTRNDVSEMTSEDIVEHDGDLWRVVSVQKQPFRLQQREYGSEKYISSIYFIELRK